MPAIAYFIGPDDSETCDGCDEAVNGNPFTIDDVPTPGEFECGNRCRHMVQLGDDAPDDIPTYTWHASFGFHTDNSVYYSDLVPDQDLDTGYRPDEATPDYSAAIIGAGVAIATEPTEEEKDNLVISRMPDELSEPNDFKELAELMWEEGLDPVLMLEEMGLNDYAQGVLLAYYEDIAAGYIDESWLRIQLSQANVELLTALTQRVESVTPTLRQIASEGFNDADAEQAYYLAQVLSAKVIVGDDGRFYVR